jgi:hypothetical protein
MPAGRLSGRLLAVAGVIERPALGGQSRPDPLDDVRVIITPMSTSSKSARWMSSRATTLTSSLLSRRDSRARTGK